MSSPSKPLPNKVPIDMTNYPHLQNMGKDAGPIVSSIFTMINEAVAAGHIDTAKKYFGMDFQDILKEMVEGLFDYRGMMDYHPNEAKREQLIELYGHTLNPLHAAFTQEKLFDSTGMAVTFEEKFGMDPEQFNVKRWLQGLMYWSYYASLPDLAQAISLGEFALVDEEKHKNIQRLIELKPVLAYQKEHGIIPGKLIPDTGFFDCEDPPVNGMECPVCKAPGMESLIQVDDKLLVCINCKAGYTT